MPDETKTSKNRYQKNSRVKKTIEYDSTILNLGITIIGIFTPIVYYNNFNFTETDNCFSTLILCIATLLLTNIDTLMSCKSYVKKLGTLKTIKTFARASLIVTLFLSVIMLGYYLQIFAVDSNFFIVFHSDKNLNGLNSVFKSTFDCLNSKLNWSFKFNFLTLQQYVILYVFAFILQVIANCIKMYLKKNEPRLIEKWKRKQKIR